MIYLVLISGWAWTALMIAAWGTLAFQTHSRVGFRHIAVIGLVAALALQTIAASSAALVTSHNPISKYACLMGAFGMFASPIIIMVEAIVLVLWFRIWPADSQGTKRGFATWVLVWLVLNLATLLAHIRSAALCTV